MILSKIFEKFIYGISLGMGMGISFKILPKENFSNIKNIEKKEEEKYKKFLIT